MQHDHSTLTRYAYMVALLSIWLAGDRMMGCTSWLWGCSVGPSHLGVAMLGAAAGAAKISLVDMHKHAGSKQHRDAKYVLNQLCAHYAYMRVYASQPSSASMIIASSKAL